MEEGDAHFQDYHSHIVTDEGKRNIILKKLRIVTQSLLTQKVYRPPALLLLVMWLHDR